MVLVWIEFYNHIMQLNLCIIKSFIRISFIITLFESKSISSNNNFKLISNYGKPRGFITFSRNSNS